MHQAPPPAFPIDNFLARFPEFSEKDPAKIFNCGQRAMFHITSSCEGMPLDGVYREYALFLMTGHIFILDEQDNNDGDLTQSMAGVPFKASVGTVSIENTKQNSFTSDDWTYWLNQTKYGRELLAYLETRALGIFLNTPNDSVRDLL